MLKADSDQGLDVPEQPELEELWLDAIRPELREKACKALETGNVLGFLGVAYSNQHWLQLVVHNMAALKSRGLYEEALLHAYSGPRIDHTGVQLYAIRMAFESADRTRLRAAGDPLPSPGPFTLYRGVSARGAARRVRGFSWTSSRELARWYAKRLDLPAPAVFQAVVGEADVLAYLHEGFRREQEFLVWLPTNVRPKRVE